MRIYEELFIVKPDVPEEEVDQFVEQLRTQLTATGATVDKVEKWGKRRLAYKVDKYREGTYVLLEFTAEADTVKELERRLRVSDMVIKFLTVRIDKTRKRLDKRKKQRDKRAAKRAASAPPGEIGRAVSDRIDPASGFGGSSRAGDPGAAGSSGAPISRRICVLMSTSACSMSGGRDALSYCGLFLS